MLVYTYQAAAIKARGTGGSKAVRKTGAGLSLWASISVGTADNSGIYISCVIQWQVMVNVKSRKGRGLWFFIYALHEWLGKVSLIRSLKEVWEPSGRPLGEEPLSRGSNQCDIWSEHVLGLFK
jgi:hypothetical protein